MSEAKVVINACYGGFSLSTEAIRNYLQRKGLKWTEEQDGRFPSMGPYFYIEPGHEFFAARDIPRDDPDLVAVVEEMGAAADGNCAELEVKSLPKGTLYRIDEYDGYESLETRDGIDWSVA